MQSKTCNYNHSNFIKKAHNDNITMQNGKEKTILIIEDELVLSDLLAEKFTSERFKVMQAETAEKGIKLALKNHPDLILLDIILPKMDGLTMLKLLRKDIWGKNAPVIILSNTSDQARVSEAIRTGVYDFIVKTDFTLKNLVTEIREVLSY